MDILKRYLFLYTRHGRAYVVGGIFLLATNVVGLAIPRVFGAAVDAIEAGAGRREVVEYAAVIIVMAAVQTVMRVGSRIAVLSVSRRVTYRLKKLVHDRLLQLAPSFFDATSTGDLMSRMTNDVMLVRALGGPAVLYSANALFVYAIGLAYMISISWRLTLIVFLPLPFIALLVRVLVHRVREYAMASRVALSDLNTMVQENLSGVMVVKSFALEDAQIERFESLSTNYMDWGLKEAWTRAQMIPVVGLGGGVASVAVLFFGGHMVSAGTLSIGDLVAFFWYISAIVMPTVSLGWILSLIQRAAVALERLDEVLNAPRTIVAVAEPRPFPTEPGVLEVNGLTFRYDDSLRRYGAILKLEDNELDSGRREALVDIDLRAAPGEYVALVGRVGSGKSTLLKAIQHLVELPAGKVRLAGVDVCELDVATLRRHVAFVPQDDFLFSTPVFDNIAYGRPEASASEVAAAAEAAGLTSDVDALPDGLDTVVGERGATLSGGQRQRVALARALLVDADILVLDNALSNVDADTERRILDRLRGIGDAAASHRADRMLIVSSNRIGSIRDADRIYVMDAGRIVDRGTHDELAARPGPYAAMFEQQQLSAELEQL